jgi:Protein of unknown function (DUF3349)
VTLNDKLRAVVDWLHEGYPAGVPPTDYIPLLALLRRRLSEDEVREVALELATGDNYTRTDIGVVITRITDALPREEDIERVEDHLGQTGWPSP